MHFIQVHLKMILTFPYLFKNVLFRTLIHSLTLLIKDMHAKGTGEEVETIHKVWVKGIQS